MRTLAVTVILIGAAALAACDAGEKSTSVAVTVQEHAAEQSLETEENGDAAGARQAVHLTADQERALGVVYTTIRRGPLTRTIRTVGRIEAAEPNISDITPKIDGFVEELYVSTTGESVRRRQPLLALYSPLLVAAQEELLTAKRLSEQIDPSAPEPSGYALDMLEAARRRLAYWDITPEQIEQIEATGEVTKTLTLVSPVNGIVLEKDVFEGQQVRPGMRLYRLADLSTVWVEGDVFEQDLQFVQEGSQAHIEIAAYPGEHVMGQVSFVYPTVDERSRTNRVRVTVPNPDLRLKPGMFTTIFFDVRIGEGTLSLPLDAVVATGERNLVFVRDADGMLTPREVVLGARAGDRVQILSGLLEGETVVASANFLVDAESRLATTGGGMPGMQHGATIEPQSAADSTGTEHNHD